jgi:ERCC4-related helicase
MPPAGEDPGGDLSLKVRLRSYQHEMLKKSLERNVIVAMPTGSKNTLLGPDVDSTLLTMFVGGKTHIAIARIQAELERSQPDKVRRIYSCRTAPD